MTCPVCVLAFRVWSTELALQVMVHGCNIWHCQRLVSQCLRELWADCETNRVIMANKVFFFFISHEHSPGCNTRVTFVHYSRLGGETASPCPTPPAHRGCSVSD